MVLLPLSTAVFYTRPGVSYSQISDIPSNQVCLAWDATRRSRLIQDFAAIAADYLPVGSRCSDIAARLSAASAARDADLMPPRAAGGTFSRRLGEVS